MIRFQVVTLRGGVNVWVNEAVALSQLVDGGGCSESARSRVPLLLRFSGSVSVEADAVTLGSG